MLKVSILVAVACLATSTVVSSQTPPSQTIPTQPGYTREAAQGVLHQNVYRQREMAAAYADSIRQRAADRRSDERMDRAARLAALANAGQCRQAVNIARREGDIYMMRSLINHCDLPDRTYD